MTSRALKIYSSFTLMPFFRSKIDITILSFKKHIKIKHEITKGENSNRARIIRKQGKTTKI